VSRWVSRSRAASEIRARLFFFPAAGSGTARARSWARQLPPTIEICYVQLPGRESRMEEEPFTSFAALLSDLDAALDPWIDLPFVLLGHSMGALLAFELACLRARDRRSLPAKLIVLGHGGPSCPSRLRQVNGMSDDDLVRWLRQMGGTPDEVFDKPELLNLLLPTLRADLSVCGSYTYVPRPPLACPITVVGGVQDPHASRSELEAWRRETIGPCRVRMLPGDHFFLYSSEREFVRVVSDEVRSVAVEPRSSALP
jgi:medium-chain acyl-[acyl-carrier-protein] hydrolase